VPARECVSAPRLEITLRRYVLLSKSACHESVVQTAESGCLSGRLKVNSLRARTVTFQPSVMLSLSNAAASLGQSQKEPCRRFTGGKTTFADIFNGRSQLIARPCGEVYPSFSHTQIRKRQRKLRGTWIFNKLTGPRRSSHRPFLRMRLGNTSVTGAAGDDIGVQRHRAIPGQRPAFQIHAGGYTD
jgi:hypothetical protein